MKKRKSKLLDKFSLDFTKKLEKMCGQKTVTTKTIEQEKPKLKNSVIRSTEAFIPPLPPSFKKSKVTVENTVKPKSIVVTSKHHEALDKKLHDLNLFLIDDCKDKLTKPKSSLFDFLKQNHEFHIFVFGFLFGGITVLSLFGIN